MKTAKPPHPTGTSFDLIGGKCCRVYCAWCCGCGVCITGDAAWRQATGVATAPHAASGGVSLGSKP